MVAEAHHTDGAHLHVSADVHLHGVAAHVADLAVQFADDEDAAVRLAAATVDRSPVTHSSDRVTTIILPGQIFI